MAKHIYDLTMHVAGLENRKGVVFVTLRHPVGPELQPDIIMPMNGDHFRELMPLLGQEVKVSFTLLPEKK